MSPKVLPWSIGAALVAALGWAWLAGLVPWRGPDASITGKTLRKCERAGATVYTDVPCPSGSRELGVDGGSVSVLPASPATRPSGAASGSGGNVRDLLGSPADANLKDQRMDRIIGK